MDSKQSGIAILNPDAVFALLEDTRERVDSLASLLFIDSFDQIIAYDHAEVASALNAIDEARRSGHYLCGYIAYEAGYYIVDKQDFSFAKSSKNNFPLVHFYMFSRCIHLTPEETDNLIDNSAPREECAVFDLTLTESKDRYLSNLEKIHGYILDGDTYQINHTLKYRFKYEGAPLCLYRELRQRQPVEYSAFLNFPEGHILSLSPELFIRKIGSVLESKPMKGTARRGSTEAEDEAIIQSLKNDPKTQSENVMIVDLIRNDISRIGRPGTVRVKDLFEVQTFKTLHQVISTIQGDVDKDVSISEVMTNLFPCGSITGAPKIRTMEIIEEIEAENRGVYTGAIGYIMPNNDFCFNVPIRTIVSSAPGKAEMGIGSGIIFEANAHEEYDECLLKAKFLTGINEKFQLIEAILFNADVKTFSNLTLHLARLKRSAETFGFIYDQAKIVSALNEATAAVATGFYKVRLLLQKNGEQNVTIAPVSRDTPVQRNLVISEHRVDSNSIFQYHKTTIRDRYEMAYQQAVAQGAYDVVFLNEREQLTEASRHNLFIEKSGKLFTPPLEAGILLGIFRETILHDSRYSAIEKNLSHADLASADRVFLTNAIRGIVEVKFETVNAGATKYKDDKYDLFNR